MKILYVIPTMGCGGAEILLGAIARNLVNKGHEVHILCLLSHHETWPNFPDRDALEEEVKVTVIGGSVKFRFLRKPEIDNDAFRSYVERIKPDVIHSHLYLSELISRSVQFKGIKYFSHGHDNMPQLKRFTIKTILSKALLANYWERIWLLKQYKIFNNQFIAISTDVKKYLEQNVSEFKNRITYLPNAIDSSRFQRNRTYSVGKKNFHIVSIANLVPKKNHAFLIDVLSVLVKRGYDVTIDVLGFGPLMETLVEKTKDAGLENRLKFLGSVGDVPKRLWDADLYVHPACYEPFGLVILEAMSTGLPVVSLDGFGNRELMVNNENGFIVPTDATADEFADKIQYFIDQPSEIERMGKFALEFSKTYDISHYTDKLLEIYQTK
jgi:glycosyltransferase involved in cell wall biosynthesis